MIEVRNLVKNYGPFRAVKNISFSVEPGHIYGFLGPNGAGKSTTMNMITGTLAPTSGTVTINGHDIYEEPLEAKRSIGYLPEIPPLYTEMTPDEYLGFVASAKGLKGGELAQEIEDVIDLTGLGDVRRRLIKNLSKGYRQRVGIAQAMLGDPDIIILDEPTVGLDPKQIIEIRELIRALGEKHTVILSSHILSEISAVCDRVIIIAKGKIVANDTLVNLEATYSSDCRLKLTVRGGDAEAKKLIEALDPICDAVERLDAVEKNTVLLSLSHKKDSDIRPAVFERVCRAGVTLLSLVPEVKTLEDIFLELTENADVADAESETPAKPDGDTPDAPDEAQEDETPNDTEDGGYKPLFG